MRFTMRKMSTRRILMLALAVSVLAVFAGVLAARSFAAGNEIYCNACMVGAAPAVSTERWTFYDNGMVTAHYVDQQIYDYNANLGVTSCSLAANNVNVLTISCSPSTAHASSRCHILHGTGPDTAWCEAHYSGG